MPRLTAELISFAPSRVNPLQQRELDLRGLKIPAIENLSCTQDLYDALDLCDNALATLDNLPPLPRLRALLLSGNRLASIGGGVARAVPGLELLALAGNRLGSLADIEGLAPLPRLETLVLLGNPLVKLPLYRTYTVSRFPLLRMLDGQRVTAKEREAANAWGASKKGKAFVKELVATRASAGGGAVVGDWGVGTGAGAGAGAGGGGGGTIVGAGAASSSLPPDLLSRLQDAIGRATSGAEIDELERALKEGNVLEALARSDAAAAAKSAGSTGVGGGGAAWVAATVVGAAAAAHAAATAAVVSGGGGGDEAPGT